MTYLSFRQASCPSVASCTVHVSGDCCYCTRVWRLLLPYTCLEIVVTVHVSGDCCYCTRVWRLLLLYTFLEIVVTVHVSGDCCYCTRVWRLLLLYTFLEIVVTVPSLTVPHCTCSIIPSWRCHSTCCTHLHRIRRAFHT